MLQMLKIVSVIGPKYLKWLTFGGTDNVKHFQAA